MKDKVLTKEEVVERLREAGMTRQVCLDFAMATAPPGVTEMEAEAFIALYQADELASEFCSQPDGQNDVAAWKAMRAGEQSF